MRGIKIIAVFLVCCIVLSGCSFASDFSALLNSSKIVEKVENSVYFGFSNGEILKEEKEEYLSADFFSDYSWQYTHLRSDIYFNALSEKQQQVYLALEYALENSYSNILVDSALVQSVDEIIKVAEYLSLDSPLLEQNLRFEGGTFTSSIPVEITDFYTTYADFDGYYITLFNFSADIFNKKLLAVEAAQDIIENLPKNLSKFEKAEKLYLILAENVVYQKYEDDDGKTKVYSYLYDAIINGKTQCDGYANALSLLLRLAGIEAAEKMYSSQEEIGHTWTAFEIDDVWYNADASSKDFIPKKSCSMRSGLYFAFSDELRTFLEDYDEVIPYCQESKYAKPDMVFQDISDDSFLKTVLDAFDSKQPNWSLILVKNHSEDVLKKQIQKCANSTLTTVYWSSLLLANGYTAVLVYTNGLF